MMNEEKTNDVVARNGCHKVNQLLKDLDTIVRYGACWKYNNPYNVKECKEFCNECHHAYLEKSILEVQLEHLTEVSKLKDEISRLESEVDRLNDEIWDLEQDVEYWQDSYYEKLEEDELDFERNENY